MFCRSDIGYEEIRDPPSSSSSPLLFDDLVDRPSPPTPELHVESDGVGKTFLAKVFLPSMQDYLKGQVTITRSKVTNHVQWKTLNHPDGNYQLDLYHGLAFGSREILLDGQLLLKDRHFFDTGSQFSFYVKQSKITVKVVALDTKFEYQLFLNGEKLEPCDEEDLYERRGESSLV